jgi:hypothetical protein
MVQDLVQNNIKKITYDKKYEKAPLICMFVTGLVTVLTFICSIKFNLPINLMFAPMALGAFVILMYLFILSNHYNHSDLLRHDLAIKFIVSEIGKVTWISIGRQVTIIRAEFFIQSNKIIYEDQFKSYDGMNDLTEGDDIQVKYNPRNLTEFVLCKIEK